jgi:hypothetical protein
MSWSLVHALRDLCLEIGSERLGDSFPRRFIGNLLGSLGATHRGFLLLCIPLTPERPPAGVNDMYSGLAASTRALDLRGCEAINWYEKITSAFRIWHGWEMGARARAVLGCHAGRVEGFILQIIWTLSFLFRKIIERASEGARKEG